MNKHLTLPFSLLSLLSLVLVLACDYQKQQIDNAKPLAQIQQPVLPPVPQPDPVAYGIKRIKLGMTLKDFMATKPNIDLTFMSDGVKCYVLKETIAGIKCGPICSFEDFGDGKVLVRLQFSARDYDYSAIKEALVEKYGPPIKSNEITKHNAMGASFRGEELLWKNGLSAIKAEQVGAKVSECNFTFGYNDPKHRISKEDQAKSKKSKDI